MGIQPYSPSHGISPLSKADAPAASRSSRSPGSSASALTQAAVQQHVRLPALRYSLARLGRAGSRSRSMIMVRAPDWAEAAAASSPARLAPITTTRMAST